MAKRRRGSDRGEAREARRAREFERLIDRALATIPDPFRIALSEVAIVVEDEPADQQLLDNGLALDESMYGLYEGVPRTEWGSDWAIAPNKITLFRGPLEDDFPDRAELEDEVRLTVVHELAHHLGIDDDRLEELGAG
ncbi:MAG TPA: metallopeptidase family protein [Candidatus Limnocylindrales bacterium]|nr:metallopeptidase family protein [Candidatus Limnocylindrales bacterium]